jgi:ABC-type sugar transport system ATPase subunit
MDNSIKIKNLNMVYTGLEDDDGTGLGVLSNVNLEGPDNEFVSYLGPADAEKVRS